MGNCWKRSEISDNNIIFEEYDNYEPIESENMKTTYKDRISSFRKSMFVSLGAMKKNLTIAYNANFKKDYDRKQTIKELIIKHKDNKQEIAEPDIEDELSLEHESLIRKILLDKNLISHFLVEDTMNEIISFFYIAKLKKDMKLFKEGEPASLFFINFQGKLVKVKGKDISTISSGLAFGDEALKPNSLRKYSIKTKTDSTLLCLFGEAYRNAMEVTNAKGLEERLEALKKIYVFRYLNEETQKKLASKLRKRTTKGIIISESSFFEKILFIIKGKVICKKYLQQNKILYDNQYFGEIGLFLEYLSNFTYEAEQEVLIYELDYYQVAEIVGQDYANIIIETIFKNTIKNSSRLRDYFAGEGISALYNIFHLEYYQSDKVVFSKNIKINKKICILLSGKLVKMSNPEIVIAETEDLFGENIIDSTDNLDTDLISLDGCLIFEAYWSDIMKSFKSNTSKDLSIYARISNLKKNPIFSILSEFKLFLLCKEFQSLEFKPNDEINFNNIGNSEKSISFSKDKNDKANSSLQLNRIHNGYLDSPEKKKENFIKITNVNGYYTNNFFSSFNVDCKSFQHKNEINNINKVFTGETKTNSKDVKSSFKKEEHISYNNILISKIFIIIEGKIKFYKSGIFIKELETNGIFGDISFGINLNVNNGEKAIAEGTVKCYCIDAKIFQENVDENYFNYIQSILVLQDTSIELEHLFFVKNIGYGKYGKVFLVHNKKNLYALKAAKIKEIKKEIFLVNYYMNEKILMQQIDHPFIIKLVKTIKNQEMIFFLLEFIDGITVKYYLEKRSKNDNKNIVEAQFLGAILLNIINYLHKKRIIHRDIKPDNIMIDQNLIDFGISKQMLEKDYTTTLVGTPHYIAPEVIIGKGYSFSSDYWSIGVCMFEVFYGFLPFGQHCKDVLEIYNEILKSNFDLSSNPKYSDINNFFKIILYKSVNQRIYNYSLLISHALFQNFEIERLIEFSMKSPFKYQKFTETSSSLRQNYLHNMNTPLNNYLESNLYYINSSEISDEETNKIDYFKEF